jgi:hypothetical protein
MTKTLYSLVFWSFFVSQLHHASSFPLSHGETNIIHHARTVLIKPQSSRTFSSSSELARTTHLRTRSPDGLILPAAPALAVYLPIPGVKGCTARLQIFGLATIVPNVIHYWADLDMCLQACPRRNPIPWIHRSRLSPPSRNLTRFKVSPSITVPVQNHHCRLFPRLRGPASSTIRVSISVLVHNRRCLLPPLRNLPRLVGIQHRRISVWHLEQGWVSCRRPCRPGYQRTGVRLVALRLGLGH